MGKDKGGRSRINNPLEFYRINFILDRIAKKELAFITGIVHLTDRK